MSSHSEQMYKYFPLLKELVLRDLKIKYIGKHNTQNAHHE